MRRLHICGVTWKYITSRLPWFYDSFVDLSESPVNTINLFFYPNVTATL